jgi:hypothetical protein
VIYFSTKWYISWLDAVLASSCVLTLVAPPNVESLRLDPRPSPLEAFVVSAIGDNEYPNQMLESHSVGHVVLTEVRYNISRVILLALNHCCSRPRHVTKFAKEYPRGGCNSIVTPPMRKLSAIVHAKHAWNSWKWVQSATKIKSFVGDIVFLSSTDQTSRLALMSQSFKWGFNAIFTRLLCTAYGCSSVSVTVVSSGFSVAKKRQTRPAMPHPVPILSTCYSPDGVPISLIYLT